MKQNYLKMALLSLFLGITLGAVAIDYPHYPTQAPVVGGQYVLCNLAVPTGYMSRTGWDGAYYFLGENDSHYADHAFTAQKDEEGRWFFTTSETPASVEEGEEPYNIYTYVGVPSGTDNLNGNLTEEAYFALEPGVADGFYMLKALEGNYSATQGMFLHLNAGGQYFVISEPSQGWYPDFYGGVKLEEDDTPVYIYDEETGQTLQVMADSTSMNWAFVKVEEVPTFVMLGNAYAFMANYEKNYLGIEGYETGFQATLNAALPLYKAIVSQEGFDVMKAMVQAKIDLYTQILKAEELDATALAKAIETAKTAFDTLTDTEAVNAALVALTKACNDYSLGLGDITSMGQNMSFEDLSAQNGSESSNVSPAPKGWTVYVNGEQMAEGATDLVSSFNWHGVNSDCAGYKDGNVGFGIWAASIPEYEISQTITGLENGTYTITAGLMLDYRRTTQRIFGNLNSTLFGYEDSYVEGILPGEYKTYGDLYECTDERTLQQLSVRAYVYDGTLTFGVKTNGDRSATYRETGAGGDGWFKVDNFTITKDGFIEDDQVRLYNYLADALEDLAGQPMDATYRERYEVTYDNLDEGIAAMAILLPEAEAQVQAYKPLATALDLAQVNLQNCFDAGYAGVEAFAAFIEEVEQNYNQGAYKAEEIPGVVASLDEAYQECLRSGVDEGGDVSDLVRNRSFEDLSNQGGNNSDGVANPPFGWELRVNGVLCQTADELKAQGLDGWCAINSGDNINVEDENGTVWTHQYTDGTHLWGIWDSSMPAIELSQVITGLKPGTYQLTADVMVRNTDWSGDNLTTQRIFANDVICLYGMDGYDYVPELLQGTTSDDIYQTWNRGYNEGIFLDEEAGYDFINYGGHDANYNDQLLRTLVLHFGVGEDGVARIGFRTDNLDGTTGEPQTESAAGWFKVDNFTLFYESSKIPTAIETIDNAQPTIYDAAIYDLSGRRVEKAVKGIYIQNGQKIIK